MTAIAATAFIPGVYDPLHCPVKPVIFALSSGNMVFIDSDILLVSARRFYGSFQMDLGGDVSLLGTGCLGG
jgi:hypothetical protein